MATDASTGLQGIDPGVWEQLARNINDLKAEGDPGTTAEELKRDYIAEAQAFEDKGVEAPEVTKLLSGEADKWEPWEIRIIGPISVYGGAEFSFGKDWVLRAEVGIKLSGKVIWKEGFNLNSKLNSISWEKSLGVVWGKLSVGIHGEKKCLQVSGEACYWWGKWHCAGFNETVGCFG
ncbi:hypothetical protein SNS2_5349 [Streptomyces netropsis]|uniref:Uncharacterized protein n=1 Tax=Streptomyces syringium TaxID=76729 RepID=A0ABS4YBA9_9ACTN|nr:hypothetical protein [Streptomyces syringium]MBP2406075.1 hypothetical protein [Streptomyces syringium]SPE64024.1 hypothetical protein SNS2_5349 [Streptomyces netropsis]